MHIALVLGAGASLANAQHFRHERGLDTHPPLDTTFFQKLRVRDVPLAPSLRTYFRQLSGSDPTPSVLERLRMEDFFKDLYYDFQDRPSDPTLRAAYTQLVAAYTRVLRETTNWLCEDSRTGAPVGRLIAKAAKVASTVSIITFNHDLVIENEIFKRAQLRKRWCLEEGYGAIGHSMTMLRSGVPGADFPAHSASCDHAKPISVFKLHGSLNWIFRLRGLQPSVKQLTGHGQPRELLCSRRRQIIGRLRYTKKSKSGKGRSSWSTWPLVIPPIYAKQLQLQLVQPAWKEARDALERADSMVFFGYSLPPADIEAAKLFERAITANRALVGIDVVNPDPASPSRFAGLVPKKPLRWFPTLDLFLESVPFSR